MSMPSVCSRTLPAIFDLSIPVVGSCTPLDAALLWDDAQFAWYTVPKLYGVGTAKIQFVLRVSNISGNTCTFSLEIYDASIIPLFLVETVVKTGVNGCPTINTVLHASALNRYSGCSATSGPDITIHE